MGTGADERPALIAKKRLTRNFIIVDFLLAGVAVALWPVLSPYVSAAHSKSAFDWLLLTLYAIFIGGIMGDLMQESGEYQEADERLKKLDATKS